MGKLDNSNMCILGGNACNVPQHDLNGCHACERVGSARFAFDFDPNGKFLDSTLLDVRSGSK